jgi:ubiquinone/menaquinone biosynthesis C-methylase UbiE
MKNPLQHLSRSAWLEELALAAEGSSGQANAAHMPKFPASEIQIQTTGQAGRATLEEGFAFYEDTCLAYERHTGRALGHNDKVLDFGTGWGRILRFFVREVGSANCYGTDVNPDLVELCRTLFESDNFAVNSAFPPTSFPDNTFSLIVGYSVFSHLSEAACRAWMKEFYRLLKPGGLAALTTRGRWFFDYCESLKDQSPKENYARGLAELFVDFKAAKERYDAGYIVHKTSPRVSGGAALGPEFYGETFIPEAWAQTAFLPLMLLAEFYDMPERQTHPILFFVRATS